MPMKDPIWYSFQATLPKLAGIYAIVNANNQVIYVGQTDDFDRRMQEHRNDVYHKMHSWGPAGVWVEFEANAVTRLSREAALIFEYSPPANG